MTAYIPQLRERIAIFKQKSNPDGFGGFIETWQAINYYWASVRLATTRTFVQSQSLGQRLGSHEAKDALFEIITRVQVPLNSSMRLHWQKRILAIVSEPVPTMNKHYQLCYACQLKPSEGGTNA